MIEQPPKLQSDITGKAIELVTNPQYNSLFSKIDNEYMYWDKVKYIAPQNVEARILWAAVKLRRCYNVVELQFGKLTFHFTITGRMQQILHEFDMNLGGNLATDSVIPVKDHKSYLINSIMEEAIASSQMEGASTTRRIAKDMLRKQKKPINKSQQMILNNFTTIQYLVENSSEDFCVEKLLEIHKLISFKTLANPEEEGHIRTSDNIYVMDDVTGEIVHTPPLAIDLPNLLVGLCDFANDNNSEPFVHPIIKGIIIHFMLAYFHPFVDGNGRTSRSLVYWYLLKNGYWLTEFLSISRVIYKNKSKYEKSFLYTELDGLDLTYFLTYNLDAMKKAYEDLKIYLQRKIKEQEEIYAFRGLDHINERQAKILRLFIEKPHSMITAKEMTMRFSVTTKTIRTDLQRLVDYRLLEEQPINKKMVGYVRSKDFEEILEKHS